MTKTKNCPKCGALPLTDFPTQIKRGKVVIRERCRKCVNEAQCASYARHRESRQMRNRAAYQADKENRNRKTREYHAKNRESINAKRRANKTVLSQANWKQRLKKLGLTETDYKQMLELQSGSCAICKSTDTGRTNVFPVDHDHATGEVRGLLCHKCNQGLGLLGDSIETLLSAIEYLTPTKSRLIA